MNNPNNPFPDEMEELPLKPPPQQSPGQTPPSNENVAQSAPPGPEIGESAQTGQEEALTIRFAIGKLNDYLLWFLMVLEVTLLIQFFLMLIGADPCNLFAGFMYALTVIPLFPFNGIVSPTYIGSCTKSGTGCGTGCAAIEWSTLIAIAVYCLVFYALRRFLHILISSPEEPVQ